MRAVIEPAGLSGSVRAIASKSVAHRALMCAATCEGTTNIECNASSEDIAATIRCLQALGARIARTKGGMRVVPIDRTLSKGRPVTLDVGESGSTLRFLLPIAAALGAHATFVGHGRIAERPLAPLLDQLARHGVSISASRLPLTLEGRLTGGAFTMPGNLSSQFASGLLLAAPLVAGAVDVLVSEPMASAPYVTITRDVLSSFGTVVENERCLVDGVSHLLYRSPGHASLTSPGTYRVEGDWSNAAFWLAAGSLAGAGIEVRGLNLASAQGDRAICAALSLLGARIGRGSDSAGATRGNPRPATIDLSDIPDLAAPLAAVAASIPATTHLTGAARLRLKESDRLASITQALRALGAQVEVGEDALAITGGTLVGGEVDAAGDHRIAMMAAIAATVATGPTTITGAECVSKSYPAFFDDFSSLGGSVLLQG